MRIVYRGGHFMEKIVAKRLVRWRGGVAMRDRLTYAKHGMKKPLGQLAKINGQRAVAYLDKDNKIKSYTTVDEINDMFCEEKNIPEYELDFWHIYHDYRRRVIWFLFINLLCRAIRRRNVPDSIPKSGCCLAFSIPVRFPTKKSSWKMKKENRQIGGLRKCNHIKSL